MPVRTRDSDKWIQWKIAGVSVFFGFVLPAVLICGGIGYLTVFITDSMEQSCFDRCEGRDQEMASFTVFGCDCREKVDE